MLTILLTGCEELSHLFGPKDYIPYAGPLLGAWEGENSSGQVLVWFNDDNTATFEIPLDENWKVCYTGGFTHAENMIVLDGLDWVIEVYVTAAEDTLIVILEDPDGDIETLTLTRV